NTFQFEFSNTPSDITATPAGAPSPGGEVVSGPHFPGGRSTMRMRRSSALLVAVALASSVAACGSRVGDEERDLALASYGGLRSGQDDGDGRRADDTTGGVIIGGDDLAGDAESTTGGGTDG